MLASPFINVRLGIRLVNIQQTSMYSDMSLARGTANSALTQQQAPTQAERSMQTAQKENSSILSPPEGSDRGTLLDILV